MEGATEKEKNVRSSYIGLHLSIHAKKEPKHLCTSRACHVHNTCNTYNTVRYIQYVQYVQNLQYVQHYLILLRQ